MYTPCRNVQERIAILFIALLCYGAAATRAENWPGWRGPTGLGYTAEADLPRTWDARTGESIVWKAELHGGRKRNPEFASSGWYWPIATPDGRIYFASSGRIYVIQAGPEHNELAVNNLNDNRDYTSAAVSNGRIFTKGKSYLWCIGAK